MKPPSEVMGERSHKLSILHYLKINGRTGTCAVQAVSVKTVETFPLVARAGRESNPQPSDP